MCWWVIVAITLHPFGGTVDRERWKELAACRLAAFDYRNTHGPADKVICVRRCEEDGR